MNITVYHKNKLFRIEYAAIPDKVQQGVFKIINENNEIIKVSDAALYNAILTLFKRIKFFKDNSS